MIGTLILCMVGNLSCFCCRLLTFFQDLHFQKMKRSVGPDLGPNCLQRLSVEDMGVQWLSGRVLDSRLRGHGFEPPWHHCVVSLSKTLILTKYWFNPRRPVPL